MGNIDDGGCKLIGLYVILCERIDRNVENVEWIKCSENYIINLRLFKDLYDVVYIVLLCKKKNYCLYSYNDL